MCTIDNNWHLRFCTQFIDQIFHIINRWENQTTIWSQHQILRSGTCLYEKEKKSEKFIIFCLYCIVCVLRILHRAIAVFLLLSFFFVSLSFALSQSQKSHLICISDYVFCDLFKLSPLNFVSFSKIGKITKKNYHEYYLHIHCA